MTTTMSTLKQAHPYANALYNLSLNLYRREEKVNVFFRLILEIKTITNIIEEIPELKATSLGVLGTITGLATIAASTVAGFLWQHKGPAWTFIYGAAGAFACALLLILLLPRTDKTLS